MKRSPHHIFCLGCYVIAAGSCTAVGLAPGTLPLLSFAMGMAATFFAIAALYALCEWF